mmetsp:Transcript_13868/g.31805  ORF Transcript_13868/g.31805 Transcript_13868/m.31805 type:complete len:375 (+) Transcript_13868:1888-3012(+)
MISSFCRRSRLHLRLDRPSHLQHGVRSLVECACGYDAISLHLALHTVVTRGEWQHCEECLSPPVKQLVECMPVRRVEHAKAVVVVRRRHAVHLPRHHHRDTELRVDGVRRSSVRPVANLLTTAAHRTLRLAVPPVQHLEHMVQLRGIAARGNLPLVIVRHEQRLHSTVHVHPNVRLEGGELSVQHERLRFAVWEIPRVFLARIVISLLDAPVELPITIRIHTSAVLALAELTSLHLVPTPLVFHGHNVEYGLVVLRDDLVKLLVKLYTCGERLDALKHFQHAQRQLRSDDFATVFPKVVEDAQFVRRHSARGQPPRLDDDERHARLVRPFYGRRRDCSHAHGLWVARDHVCNSLHGVVVRVVHVPVRLCECVGV